ncbi:MAG: kynureninase [Hyphomonadaceae bacterium]
MTPEALDAADPLRRYRDQFELPHGMIYLAGHSLGPPPRRTIARVAEVIQNEWGHTLAPAWERHDWIHAPQRVGGKIAQLIGADAEEVLAADSTSVNLFKLLGALMLLKPERKAVLIESGEFPTDMHVAQGAVAAFGKGRRMKFAPKGRLADRIDERVGFVIASHVHYRDARIRDMAALQKRAQEAGALLIWDLSHSAGAIPVDLHAAYADFAIGCGYKHLNGGPGAPAYLYVAKRWQDDLANPISGWLGHAAPFSFVDAYAPAEGIARFQAGTPSIIAMAAFEAALDLILETSAEARRAKALSLQRVFLETVFAKRPAGLTLLSPEDDALRAGHVSLRHRQAETLIAILAAQGVIGDFRPPDVMRFSFSPLFTAHIEAARAGEILLAALRSARVRERI